MAGIITAPRQNKTNGFVKKNIVPYPVYHDEQFIPETDEIHNMDKQPEDPGEISFELPTGYFRYGGISADCGHGAFVPVDEFPELEARDLPRDVLRRVDALLNGNGGYHGQGSGLGFKP